jgi:hypothetical protein
VDAFAGIVRFSAAGRRSAKAQHFIASETSYSLDENLQAVDRLSLSTLLIT